MKIGIVTFHRALNYGAVLQAYALCHFLNDNGFDAEIIDYRNKALETIYHSSKINLNNMQQYQGYSLKNKIRRFFEVIYFKKLCLKFDSFLEKNLSNTITDLSWDKVINQYDWIVTGSDQVFNFTLTDNDIIYYLQGVPFEKRASFAASVGAFNVVKNRKCIEELNLFSFLSVREEETAQLFEDITKKKCYCHMDPVFLLDKRDWTNVEKRPHVHKPYILIFSMNKSANLVEKALTYAKKNNSEVYFLSTALKRKMRRGVHQIWNASPCEFLGWIHHADYIFTDSFHGTAFSILFEKCFFVDADPKLGSSNRIFNVLKYFGCVDNTDDKKIGNIPIVKIENELRNNLENARNYFIKFKGEIENEK